ncbi:MAG: division/cell wall cluster transcriptional repressor MraZ [Candidatus Eremiobacteraeota bacterium]|nr:division/cell wall cluster transcriptional repressor MraZ [Candidatus Eremiobacteraeota bacterium]
MEQKLKFVGEFDHTLDPKGRIIIPAKYREPLGTKVYLVKSWEKECVYLLPQEEWERIMRDYLENISPFDEEGQEFRRSLASDVEDSEMDRQGRVFIPQKLRAHAGIDSAVTIIGVLNRLELWDTEKWRKQKESKPFKQLARQVENRFNRAYTSTSG